MFKIYELVALKHDFDEEHLKTGDVGMVVYCYDDGKGYEVEFSNAEGETIAVLTTSESDLQKLNSNQILHIREFAA